MPGRKGSGGDSGLVLDLVFKSSNILWDSGVWFSIPLCLYMLHLASMHLLSLSSSFVPVVSSSGRRAR